MENQHGHITGYRELGEAEIGVVNAIKAAGERLGNLVQTLRNRPDMYDQQWVSIGATDLQTGIMALVRAVTKPTTF